MSPPDSHGSHHQSFAKPPAPERPHYRHAGISGGHRAFMVALFGYVVLTVRQPDRWGHALWLALALLVIPAAAGVAGTMRSAGTEGRGLIFWQVAKGVAWAMALYAGLNLFVLRLRFAGFLEGLLTIFLVTLSYAVVAGVVAGATAALVNRPKGGETA